MKLNEEKELSKITKEFSESIKLFAEKNFAGAQKAFGQIVEKFKDTEYYSIEEISTRASIYKSICESRLNPAKVELENDQDYLNNGVYNINAGKFDEALDVLKQLEEKGYDDPYLPYLLSIVYLKKDQTEESLNQLKKSIAKDQHYKIIAHNEPDFLAIFDNEEFQNIIA